MAVSLSLGVRSALLSLQNTSAQSQLAQMRLSTGKKVNSALDNPTSFFVAAGLQNRAGDLSRLLDDMGQGTKVLEAADKGITAIRKLVESAQGTLRQALQSASTTPKITGSGTVTASTTLASLGFAVGDTIKLAQNGGAATTVITVAAGSTIQNLIDGINKNTTLNGANAATTGSGSKAFASITAEGKFQVEAINGDALDLTVTGTGTPAATVANLLGTGSASAAAGTPNATRTSLADQFDALLTQIDQLASDAGYNGVNLLKGDSLKVTFNENGSSSQSITGVKFNSAGLGLAASVNHFQSDTQVNAYLAALTTAANTLRDQASNFGANLSVVQNRQDFTKGLVSTLTAGSDALVVADQNEEAATLLALQTRQQLSQTAMSLSNQAEQAVLRLFG